MRLLFSIVFFLVFNSTHAQTRTEPLRQAPAAPAQQLPTRRPQVSQEELKGARPAAISATPQQVNQNPGSMQRTRMPQPEAVNTNPYDTVPYDPFNVKSFTLPNGLRVLLSVNKDAPRIQTYIAIKAGSKFDPPQTTGLAHYLEHMVFKGTHRIGTKDWSKESALLDSVSAYFEYHKNEKDEAKKRKLYAVIDSYSYEASKYAIPNEYDKMTTSIGAQGTNAFTSTDMTVYVNDIPSNALEKFLELESERFKTLVLRLFHTELETVYEEFNRSLDNDRRWSDANIDRTLLPNHPYGTQTTIGEGDHLKNPSMVNIYNYFDTYYRPNNAAIILAGDLDVEKTIAMIQRTFGNWQAKRIPPFEKLPAPVLSAPVEKTYVGPQPEHVYVGFLFDGANSRDAMMLKLVDNILANGEAGLIDLDLVQQQKVLNAYSFIDENTDYCFHKFYGEPKQGQKLEEVRDLLLAEIEKVKKGEFGDWVLPAIIQNLKLQRMKEAESNSGRAGNMMGTFVHNIAWADWVNEITRMERVTKADIVAWVNEKYRNNYAISYKRLGELNVHKVEKPKITSVVMNKEDVSPFKQKWDELPQPSLSPKFLDFEKDIQRPTFAGGKVPFFYIENKVNKTFSVNYIFEMGTDNIRELGLAVSYLEYLGTDKYTSEQLKTEFYKLGLSFGVNPGRDRVIVSLSGLEENLEKGVELFEHILSSVKADKEVYDAMVGDIMQKRINAKKNKGAILNSGLVSYAKYGAKNPFNNTFSKEELEKMDVEKLVGLIRSITSYKHKIFYYGSKSAADVVGVFTKLHPVKAALKDYPEAMKYPELPLNKTQVYVCYYPMKQAEIVMLGKDGLFDKSLFPYVYLYNDYYGSGLSSIMFQEVREKMALAYSVFSSYGVPAKTDESHYVFSYVGTQADKLSSALNEMNRLLNDMPLVPQQYEGARASVVKTIESDWITRDGIFWAYDRAQKRGINYDVRKEIYEKAKTMTLEELNKFFTQHVKGKKYTYCIIGKKEDLDMNALKALGDVKELSLEELFGY